MAIAESCFSSLGRNAVGAEINLSNSSLSNESLLFGETPSRIVISFTAENLEKVKETVGDCPCEVLGKVGGDLLEIKIGETTTSSTVEVLEATWRGSLKEQLES